MPFVQLLAGGLANVLPGPPALDREERAVFDVPVASGAHYTGEARESYPVIPLQVWGLRYALDVVIETVHPQWTMHEYARIDLPSRSLWIMKDADHDGLQRITADVPDIEGWVPEIPVPRFAGQVEVTDRSADGRADLRFHYTTPAGEDAVCTYAGKLPTKPSHPRNGNTMGHSRQSLAALLDIHVMRSGGKASLSFDGVESPIKRLFGLYPMKFILGQTQGGLAIADFFQATDDSGGFALTRPAPTLDAAADPWPTRRVEAWTVTDGWARRPLRTEDDVVELAYHFTNGELDRAQALQAGLDVPATDIVFSPALPDVRRPFEGTVESRFAADIAGQKGHGVGVVRTRWTGADTVVLEIRPTEPRWFADRPIDVTVTHEAAGVRVRAVRVEGG